MNGSVAYARETDNLKARAGNVTVSDIDIGAGYTEALNYVDKLKVDAIDEAIKALNAYDSLFSVFQGCWQGQSEQTFEGNFKSAVKSVNSELEMIKNSIDSLVAQLLTDVANQDAQMVDKLSIK